jgi:inner membrane protein
MLQGTKLLLKGLLMLGLIVVLLLPSLFVLKLITERKDRKDEVVQAFSKSWALPQTISAPYLYMRYIGKTSTEKPQRFIMASKNNITTNLKTTMFKRSLFTIPAYESTQQMQGRFEGENMITAQTQTGAITEIQNSFLLINVTDVKGIIGNATLTINSKTYALKSISLPEAQTKNIGIALNQLELPANNSFDYTINFTLMGTEKIKYLPIAASNEISVTANWANPSFEGNFATNNKTINDKGFKALWQITQNQTSISTIETSFPTTHENSFGILLYGGVDTYAKTLRAAKYAILIIMLTFGICFFIELLKDRNMHIIQYFLMGVALVIFYTLLLSIGEYTGFNIAYLIASIATIALITYYTVNAMKSRAYGFSIGLTLAILYGFVFYIIQLEDTALLVGSIGLFIILAVSMHLSRKITWQKQLTQPTQP